MSAFGPCAAKPVFARLRFFAMAVSLGFMLLTALLPALWGAPGSSHPVVRIRAGMIEDAAREWQIGREALFSSLALPPVPALAALPFTFLAGRGEAELAYVFGIALLLALCAGAVALALRPRWPRAATCLGPAAMLLLALGPGRGNPDLAAALGVAVAAVLLDIRVGGSHRALAGFLYLLAALCHPVGAVVALLKGVSLLTGRLRRGAGHDEESAVGWLQGFGMIYLFAVYAAFSGFILGHPLHALVRDTATLRPALRVRAVDGDVDEIWRYVVTHHANSVPVVSGHWGYLLRRRLAAAAGHHVIGFRPEQVPEWEKQERILIVPAVNHTLAPFSDLTLRRPWEMHGGLWLERVGDWHLYRVSSK